MLHTVTIDLRQRVQLVRVNENIVIWPHVSAETNVETAAEQVAKAIQLIHSGKIPENKIDLNLGY